jgi:hypothetical protein
MNQITEKKVNYIMEQYHYTSLPSGTQFSLNTINEIMVLLKKEEGPLSVQFLLTQNLRESPGPGKTGGIIRFQLSLLLVFVSALTLKYDVGNTNIIL